MERAITRFIMVYDTRSLIRKIRVRKEDSAFVYFILESHEGIVSYSTLDHEKGAAHRDLELRVPPSFTAEVEQLLIQLGDLVYELKETGEPENRQ